MPLRALSELDKSRLLNELELLPRAEKHRIDAATGSGQMLDDAHERDLQRARVAQMPWGRALGALVFTSLAIMRCLGIIDGHRSWWDWLGGFVFTTSAIYWVRRWWLMRRLGHHLDALASDDSEADPGTMRHAENNHHSDAP